jgi:O-antigen/teichoic acid export membrane protein
MPAATAVALICGSSYFAMLVGVLRSVMVMRLLGPTFQGLRRVVDMITKYLFNCHFGILHGASKQLPIYLGEHNPEKVQDVEEVSVTWITALTTVCALGMVVVGLGNPTGQRLTGLAIAIGGGWLLVQQTITVYRTILRAWGHFGLLTVAGAVDTVATFSFTLLGAWKFGVIGAMLGTLLGWCITLVVYMVYSPISLRPRFEARIAYDLARIGLPIAAYIFADTLLRTVDGAIIASCYDAYRMGLYSLAMQMAGYLYAIPESAGFVIWPRILEAYGAAAGDPKAMRRQIILPTLVSASLMPIMAGVSYILLPPMVTLVVPKFESAIPAAQVLSMASVFLALPMASNSLLIALNRELTAVLVKLVGAAVSAGGCLWLAHNHGSLEHFALAASAGYAVAALLSLSLVLPHYTAGALDAVKTCVGILAPFVWGCGALAISYELASFVAQPSAQSWTWAAARVVAFVALTVPLLLLGNRQTNLLGELRLLLIPLRRTKEVKPNE